jgi:hypothetical protein
MTEKHTLLSLPLKFTGIHLAISLFNYYCLSI